MNPADQIEAIADRAVSRLAASRAAHLRRIERQERDVTPVPSDEEDD